METNEALALLDKVRERKVLRTKDQDKEITLSYVGEGVFKYTMARGNETEKRALTEEEAIGILKNYEKSELENNIK